MRKWSSGRAGMALTFLLGVVIATAATAGAASLITGKQIKDGSISAKDLSKALRKQLARPGVTGSTGSPGPPGAKGDTGARGPSAWDTIPPGTTVTGNFQEYGTGLAGSYEDPIAFPGRAPAPVSAEQVDFAADSRTETADDDPTCTGTAQAPSAPPGKVCLYLEQAPTPGGAAGVLSGDVGRPDSTRGFTIFWSLNTSSDYRFYGTWAYTAP